MATITDRTIDPALHALRERFADLPELDLPSLQTVGRGAEASLQAVGRGAEDVVDRLRGRSRRRKLPWLLGGAFAVGTLAVVALSLVSWLRTRPATAEDDEALADMDTAGEDALGERAVAGDAGPSALTGGPATNGTGRASHRNEEPTTDGEPSATKQPRLSHHAADPLEA
jgi:hypothetical protein